MELFFILYNSLKFQNSLSKIQGRFVDLMLNVLTTQPPVGVIQNNMATNFFVYFMLALMYGKRAIIEESGDAN